LTEEKAGRVLIHGVRGVAIGKLANKPSQTEPLSIQIKLSSAASLLFVKHSPELN
jgi:hypothetical protein